MAKIQKETITITFSKLVKDSDAATDTILASHMADELQVHAQNLVDSSIMVEAAIQEADEDFGIDWDITGSDNFFIEEEAPVEEAPVEEATVEETTLDQDYIDSGF